MLLFILALAAPLPVSGESKPDPWAALLKETRNFGSKPGKPRPVNPVQAKGVAPSRSELKIRTVKAVPSYECKRRVVKGDSIVLEHTTFVEAVAPGVPESWIGLSIEKGEKKGHGVHRRLTVGTGQAFRGVDLAVETLCEGEEVSAIVPPHLAFDDPLKAALWKDTKKPVPEGTTIRYEIRVKKIKDSSKAWYIFVPIVFAAIFTVYGILDGRNKPYMMLDEDKEKKDS